MGYAVRKRLELMNRFAETSSALRDGLLELLRMATKLRLRILQGLLGRAQVRDVGIAPEPACYFSICIADRNCAREKPAVFPAFIAQWENILPGLADVERALPSFDNALPVLW